MKYGTKEYKLLDSNGNIYLSKIPGTIAGNKKLKIYGKLDCANAISWINKGYYVNNRVFFENEEIAKKNNYRPCAKCMKKEYIIWKNKERDK
ncbi:MAG: metal-binding protein [Bacilli bacterium]|nr:metal-binding protein [Bacilli bacterium]